MAKANIYLTFNGNAEEAFTFYSDVFGNELTELNRFSEMPPSSEFLIEEKDKNKIMHVTLPLSKESVIMGSDTIGEPTKNYKQGNNFSISITADSKDEADRFFGKLSEGGKIMMPMNNTFWGSYFGMCSDKFGIQWMVSFNEN